MQGMFHVWHIFMIMFFQSFEESFTIAGANVSLLLKVKNTSQTTYQSISTKKSLIVKVTLVCHSSYTIVQDLKLDYLQLNSGSFITSCDFRQGASSLCASVSSLYKVKITMTIAFIPHRVTGRIKCDNIQKAFGTVHGIE